jgi:hypothetical protein
LDQDIVEVARSLSKARGISLGAALSLLVRRGISSSSGDTAGSVDGGGRFPTFEVAESTPSFGTNEVRRALDEE